MYTTQIFFHIVKHVISGDMISFLNYFYVYWYNIMWYSLSVACDRSVGFSGFLQQ